MKAIWRLAKRIGFAWAGIQLLFRTQENARIHGTIVIAVIFTGFYLPLDRTEWTSLILSMGLVLTAEAFNTAVEYHVDYTSPEYRKTAGNIKDLAAGAVLLAAITAAITGSVVLGPHLLAAVY